MEEKERKPEAPGRFSLLGTASMMGMHMVSGPVVGAFLGWMADSWLDSWPAGAGIGLLFGVLAGFRNVWKDARYLARSEEQIDKLNNEKQGPEDTVPPSGSSRDAAPRTDEVLENLDEQDDFPASVIAGTADAQDLGEAWEDELDGLLRPYAGKQEPDSAVRE